MKDTPQALLKAACTLFAQKGFYEANVKEICRRAGANIAAINYHFGGKRKLYLKALDYAATLADQHYPLFADSDEGKEPDQRLAIFMLRQFLRASCEGPGGWFTRMLVHEMTRPSFAHSHILQRTIARNRTHLHALLKEMFPDDIPESYVWACHMNIVSLFTFPMIKHTFHRGRQKVPLPDPPPPEEMARMATVFALGGIRAIIQAAQKGEAPPVFSPPPFLECQGECYGDKTAH